MAREWRYEYLLEQDPGCAVLSRSAVSDSVRPYGCSPPGSSVLGILSGARPRTAKAMVHLAALAADTAQRILSHWACMWPQNSEPALPDSCCQWLINCILFALPGLKCKHFIQALELNKTCELEEWVSHGRMRSWDFLSLVCVFSIVVKYI